MGTVYAHDEYQGEVTRIHVTYDHPDPDWEHDPALADWLQKLRAGGHRIEGQSYYTTDPSLGQYDIVIARRG